MKLPVVLWQLNVGHINHSLSQSSFDWPGVNPGQEFSDLANAWSTDTGTYGAWEDSTPTYFFGDQFRVDTTNGSGLTDAQVKSRLSYFGIDDSDGGYAGLVSVQGNVVTWKQHISKAREAGVVCLLFGAGVGKATANTPYPETNYPPINNALTPMSPTDHYWWIDKAHKYLLSPVPVP